MAGLSRERFAELVSHPKKVTETTDNPGWDAEQVVRVLLSEKPLAEFTSESVSSIIAPLIDNAITELANRLGEVFRAGNSMIGDPVRLSNALRADLEARINTIAIRTVVLELNVAKLEGRLPGDSPERRFTAFLETLCSPQGRVQFFTEYPALLRSLAETVDKWSCAIREVFDRLAEDWDGLVKAGCCEADPGPIVELRIGAGDRHRGGRTVVRLRFQNGASLMYKPHSLAVDEHFSSFIDWINTRGLKHKLRSPQSLSFVDHGWARFIEAAGCSDRYAVERFYYRTGAQLAILYVLGSTDFHYENVIANGEYPILIDLESVLHPMLPGASSSPIQRFLQNLIQHSLLRTGLLPMRLWTSEGKRGVDLSGIGGKGGQLSPSPVLVAEHSNTDEMRLVSQHIEMGERDNQPLLSGERVDPVDYLDQLVDGFRDACTLLSVQAEPLLTKRGPLSAFSDDPVRAIVRHTKIYADLLRESYHPNVLRDALDRECLLERLWITVKVNPDRARLLPLELADLRSGDIPYFYSKPTSTSLWSSSGMELPNILAQSSADTVAKTLRNLSEDDIESQIDVIRSSFASLKDEELSFHERQISVSSDLSSDRVLTAVREGITRLARTATRDEGFVSWLELQPTQHSWVVGPSNISIYSGLAGIALSTGVIGHQLSYDVATNLSRDCVRTMIAQSRQEADYGLKRAPMLGAFSGRSGLIYSLHQLSILWQDDGLLDEALKSARSLVGLFKTSDNHTYMDGGAGELIILAELYKCTGERFLHDCCSDISTKLMHTLTNAESDLLHPFAKDASLAWGSAGLIYALRRYLALCGDDRIAAFLNRFPSVRSGSGSSGDRARSTVAVAHNYRGCEASWCSGTDGLTMAALRTGMDSHGYRMQRPIREINMCGNSSLCHGEVGQLQLIVDVYGSNSDIARGLAISLITSAESEDWFYPTPDRIKHVGLMTGLTGMLYGCLRACVDTKLPSFMMLDSMSGMRPDA